MALVVPNAAETAFLDLLLGEDYTLRLFVNDVTDSETRATADFAEADFTGYTEKTLTGGSWTVTAGDPAVGVYEVQVFTVSADQDPQTVHGYHVVHATSGELRWWETFVDGDGAAAPITVQNNGEAIRITPRFTLADTTD